MILKGIQEANQELEKESLEKLQHEVSKTYMMRMIINFIFRTDRQTPVLPFLFPMKILGSGSQPTIYTASPLSLSLSLSPPSPSLSASLPLSFLLSPSFPPYSFPPAPPVFLSLCFF